MPESWVSTWNCFTFKGKNARVLSPDGSNTTWSNKKSNYLENQIICTYFSQEIGVCLSTISRACSSGLKDQVAQICFPSNTGMKPTQAITTIMSAKLAQTASYVPTAVSADNPEFWDFSHVPKTNTDMLFDIISNHQTEMYLFPWPWLKTMITL